MVLSVVIHVAFFMVVEWLISDRAEPSIASTVLIVSLQPPPAEDGYSADEKFDDHTATSESVNPTTNRGANKASDRQAKIADATETPVATEKKPNNLGPESAAPSSGKAAATDRGHTDVRTNVASAREEALVAKSHIVTTVSENEPVVTAGAPQAERPAFAQAPLSPKQEKMLKRKFKAWTENFYRMPDVAAGLTWRHKGQEYLAKFTQLPAKDDMGIQRVIVEISTEDNGKRLSTEMCMKRLAFSNYAQFVNRWDPDVQFHNDELDGRFHSNSEIGLAYSRKVKPQFHGKVTTTARRINIARRRGYVRRDQIFLGGLQTGVKAIRLPKHFVPFPDAADVADQQVHLFDEDARITFYADGSYGWQAIGSESPQHKAAISKNASYLIAAKKVRLHVKGTVNGKVLVYSPERIVIEDDLVYVQDPEETPDADDYLGLVSDKYVDIAPPDITGPGDLVINAAIYAKRRFAVRGYRFRDTALLYIYGSLTAGTLSATEPRYYTRIQFDQRLEKLRPPGFPMTNRYVVESWDTSWKVEPIGTLH